MLGHKISAARAPHRRSAVLDLFEHRFFGDDPGSGEPGEESEIVEDTGDTPEMGEDVPTA